MSTQRIAITGGAGFVGSNLALRLRAELGAQVFAIDNLKRRGSALNLPRLQAAGVQFIHADVRSQSDLDELPAFDLLIDAAAEPSVQAGVGGSPRYVLETNLVGTVHALEAARRRGAAVMFLSTSRVYSIAALNALPFTEDESRFRWCIPAGTVGASEQGIAENFSTEGARSYYGTSKLAAELLVQEYAAQTGMPAIVNRCGVLAGPWQMGKTDQGVVSLWVAHHYFQRPLKYIGFGGAGKQVRDLLHIDDLFDLLLLQLARMPSWQGEVYNVGGGPAGAVSLAELTQLCRAATRQRSDIASDPTTSPVDIRLFITDARRVRDAFRWSPRRGPESITADIAAWLKHHHSQLQSLFAS